MTNTNNDGSLKGIHKLVLHTFEVISPLLTAKHKPSYKPMFPVFSGTKVGLYSAFEV